MCNNYTQTTFVSGGNMNKKSLTVYNVDCKTDLALPYADGGIKAGFPSPSQDYIDAAIDLNKELIKHPASTFYGRVSGDSMIDAGLHDGDIVIIDKLEKPQNGDMVVCFIDGEFTIKYIDIEHKKEGVIWLIPANPKYKPIKITPENDFIVWGKVIQIISKPQRRHK